MGVLQGVLNVIGFDMSILEAVAAPRFTANSDVIDVCNRILRYVSDALERMGYAIARSYLSYTFAGVHAIEVDGEKWSGPPIRGATAWRWKCEGRAPSQS